MNEEARRRVLIVEDDFFIATALARGLRKEDVEVVGPASSVAEAIAEIEGCGGLDGAVLDINLGRERSLPIADRLRDDHVPFVFTTGYDASTIPPPYADVARCEKPVRAMDVLAALFS